MRYELIAIDLQNDFATEGGKHYKSRACIGFLKQELFPFLQENNLNINEIVSDYRQPRPGDRGVGCTPGEWSYESIVPEELVKSTWIKCMNSPLWTRDNAGIADVEPGLPRQDVEGFTNWLNENIGSPEDSTPVLFGLTADCCVLSTAQELNWRAYYPLILKEGVDHYSGKSEDTETVLKSPMSNWADVIEWNDLKGKL